MLPLIPLLPFVGFLLNLAWGRRLSKPVSGGVACAVMAAAFVVAVALVRRLLSLDAEARFIEQTLYTWIASDDLSVSIALRLDPLASIMVLVVTGIGFLIHLYSIGYMHEENDAEYARYFSYLNLFAFFMLVLVLAANLLVMFVGWEGVGLCSYLLIGFAFRRASAADAGKKAFIVNRIGDFGFILALLMVFQRFGTFEFTRIAAALAELPAETTFGPLSLMTLLLFVGATGKSAQIPLHVWLPDAMEGPTPVSALIHAATMVTAGVYMIGRTAMLFAHAPVVLAFVAAVGVATALMAATIGLVQNDIKRVLAYSTVSQLGLMFLAMGVGAFTAGIFHLYTHAFFKALLFLGAGAIIHALAGEQDLRRMGGLRRALPLTYWTFLTGALAIAGVPLLSGFFSKDEILFRTLAGGHPWLWAVATATSFLTAVYMFRLVFLAFHGTTRLETNPSHSATGADLHRLHNGAADLRAVPTAAGPFPQRSIHDLPWSMALPLIVLAIGSMVAGYVGLPHALGGENRLERLLEPTFGAASGAFGRETGHADDHSGLSPEARGRERLELILMAVSSGIALAGIGCAVFLFLRRRDVTERLSERWFGVHRLLLNKYYVDEAYHTLFVRPLLVVSHRLLWRGVDARVIDGMVDGAGAFVRSSGARLRRWQTGSVRVYAASVFVGVVLIVGYLLWG